MSAEFDAAARIHSMSVSNSSHGSAQIDDAFSSPSTPR